MLAWILIVNVLVGVHSFLADTYVSSCNDLDTAACKLFNSSDPSICSQEQFAQHTCKRFCGNCPIECFSCTTPTRDPNSCNTTIPCGKNKSCMLKRLVTTDDSHREYMMTCERKEICEGFGKRHSGDMFSLNTREIDKRSFYIYCCDTDLCNSPQTLLAAMTKTTPPALTATSPALTATTVPNYGQKCHRDIVFVLDGSKSVGFHNFQQSVNFISDLVRYITFGDSHAKIALVTYSYTAKVNWYLNTFAGRNDVLNALKTLHYQGGNTNTESALQLVRTKVLTVPHGDRPTAENAVLVLTDGNSINKQATIQEAQKLKTIAKDVVSLLIGPRVDLSEIKAIATDGHHVIDIHSYNLLASIVPQILKLICS